MLYIKPTVKTAALALLLALSLCLCMLQAHAADVVCAQPKITITGGEQTVFNWHADHCSKMDFPDVPAYAFVDKDGKVQLLASNANGNYRMIGSSLGDVKRDCERPVLSSNPNKNAPPQAFDNRMWLTAPWTNDGQTIYALVHNEFDAWFDADKQFCQSGDKTKCWYPNAIQVMSTDTGKSYQPMRGPQGQVKIAMTTPYRYTPDGDTAGNQQGMVSQSNILSSKGADGKTYYYVMVVRSIGHDNKVGTCLFRSSDISNPEAWRGWDGKDFSAAMHNNPYSSTPSSQICAPIFSGFFCSGWTYNNVLHKYLAICRSNHFQTDQGAVEAFVYSTSADMLHWSKPEFLKRINWQGTFRASAMNSGVTAQTYPSILDPTSTGRNFEFSGASPYLYYTRFNPKERHAPWQNRDLVRVPLSVSCN